MSEDVRFRAPGSPAPYSAIMKLELAATDASQSMNPQAGLETAPGIVSRLAPIAARLEISSWLFETFDLPIEPPTPKSKITIHNS